MKKVLSVVLAVIMLLSMGTSVFAAGTNMEIEYVSTTEELRGIDALTELVVIQEDDLVLIDTTLIREYLDDSVSFMVYGNNLSFTDIKALVGDTTAFNVEMSPDLADKITAVTISKQDGKFKYNGVVDATDVVVTNNETNETMRLSQIENNANINYVHSALKFIEDIYEEITYEALTPRMPPSGADEICGNWYYDFGEYGEMKAPVYCYYLGYTSGEYYWDLMCSMTANPADGYCVVNFRTKLNANYNNQVLVDWTELPSKTDSIGVSLGGDSSGPNGGISYSTSTKGLTVDPDISYSDVTAEWFVNSRPLLLSQGDGEPVKIEPAIRISRSSSSTVKFARYYYMDIEDVFWGTSYTTDYMYAIFTISA